MKNMIRFFSVCAALAAFAGCATTQHPQTPDTVNVQVNMPASISLMYADRIADEFVDEVHHVFTQAGFQRPIENMRYVDNPEQASYILTINLMDWRFDRIGNIECTFTAQLKTPLGTRNLGVYSDTSLRLRRSPGPWGLADAFGEAAQGAIADLLRAVVKTDLLRTPTNPVLRNAGATNRV